VSEWLPALSQGFRQQSPQGTIGSCQPQAEQKVAGISPGCSGWIVGQKDMGLLSPPGPSFSMCP
jgi:hypothetical protein